MLIKRIKENKKLDVLDQLLVHLKWWNNNDTCLFIQNDLMLMLVPFTLMWLCKPKSNILYHFTLCLSLFLTNTQMWLLNRKWLPISQTLQTLWSTKHWYPLPYYHSSTHLQLHLQHYRGEANLSSVTAHTIKFLPACRPETVISVERRAKCVKQVKTPLEHLWEEDIDFLLTQAASWLPAAAAASTGNYVYITHFVVITGWYRVLHNVVALLLLNTWFMCHSTFTASIRYYTPLIFWNNSGA